MHPVRTLSVFALGTAAVAAQVFESASEGPFAGVSHAISVAPATNGPGGPLPPNELLWKDWGFQSAPPLPWSPTPGPPRPNFALLLAGAAPRPDLDAMSVGLDWILANGTGEVVVPPMNWGALTFSVTRATVGEPPTAGTTWGRIWQETRPAVPDGAAADLFSYILPGSAVPAEIVDLTQRAQDSPEMNVFAPGVPGDLDAHDLFVSLYQLDGSILTLLPAEPTFYFSVTPATVGLVPPAWWGASAPSAATILRTRWDANAQSWTTPAPFLTFAQLGLGAGDDVDALAVDETNRYLLFSTKSPALNPLLFANWGGPVPSVSIYRMLGTGEPVARRIGLRTGDDFDAICSIDPGRYLLAVGRPQARIVPGTRNVQASAFRAAQQSQIYLRSCVTGWPAGTGKGPGFAVLFVHPPGQLQPILQLAFFQRRLTNPWGGDPVQTFPNLQLPRVPFLIDVDLLWALANLQLNDLDTALPLRIRL